MSHKITTFTLKRTKQFLRPLYSKLLHKKQRGWLASIADTRDRELAGLLRETESAQRLPGRKTVLFWTMIPWSNVCLDYLLATALRLRGHKAAAVVCDGVPICELKRKAHGRPSCEACHQNALRYVKAFGLPYYPISHFLGDGDSEYSQQKIADLNTQRLKEFTYEGVRLGKYAIHSVTGYFRYLPDVIEGESLSVLEDYVRMGMANCTASKRAIQELKPDIVVTCGGQSPIWAPIFEIAETYGLRAINWEDPHVFPKSFVFSDQQPALHYDIEEYWEHYRDKPLDLEEQNKIGDLMQRFQKGGRYLDNPTATGTEVKNLLGLRDNAPLITLFTNLTWDGTIYGVESAFKSMFDWIFTVVDFGIEHDEFDVVVRAHPAETKLPAVLVPMKVCDKVRHHFPDLPSNVHLVEGSQVNSYALGLASDVVMVYITTLGMELALHGKRPWVAANAHYGRKGFTFDIESKDQMYRLLEERQFHNALTEQEIELAERYAHLLYFRHFVTMPFFHSHSNSIWEIPSFREILPGANPVIDDLCECITSDRPFIDIGAR